MLKQLRLRPLFGLLVIAGSWMLAGCGEENKPAAPTGAPPAAPANPPGTPDDATKKAP